MFPPIPDTAREQRVGDQYLIEDEWEVGGSITEGAHGQEVRD